MTLGEDKIAKPQDSIHGPKKDPNKCTKSTTGEHEWNRYPKPDNCHLGICKYCDMQRVFPWALTPNTTTGQLPPPPMPRTAALPVRMQCPKDPAVPDTSAISHKEKVRLSNASIDKTLESIVTPAKPDTAVKIKKARRKQITRTRAEKLKIIEEYRKCPLGGKRKLLSEYYVSQSVVDYWISHEDVLRSKAGMPILPQHPTPNPEKQKQISMTIPFTERLNIIDEYRSGKLGDKAAVCKKYDITKDTFDNWLKRQSYYRKVIERGIEAVHSETGKRAAILKKLRHLEDLPVEEAIGVLKDWRNILHKDAVAARAKADELAERTTLVDIAIFNLVENAERSRQSIHESLKNMEIWNGKH